MPVFNHTPTDDQLRFLTWARICLGKLSYKYVYGLNNGKNVLPIGRRIKVLKAQIETVGNYVYLPEEQRVCLSCEEIADIVRRVKHSCSDC